MADIPARLKIRRDTSVNASAINPTLADGEPMYTKDNNVLKIGDGVTPWNLLSQIGLAILGRINTWTKANIFTDDVTITGDDSLFQGSNQESESYYSTVGDKLITKAKTAATWWSQRFSNFEITNFDNTKAFIRGIVDAQIELNFNGLKRLETTSAGVTVTGVLSESARSAEAWTAVAGRALGTWYQNTTGREISVSVVGIAASGGSNLVLDVNTLPAANIVARTNQSSASSALFVAAKVRPGHYYRASTANGTTLDSWMELR